MALALLEVTDLVVHYGKALALERVSLSVERGQLVGVLGPNGAGKTTLLKAISRSVAPSAGHVIFAGQSLDGLPAHKVVGRGICHCPEGRRLFPELSVFKNLMLGAYLRNDKARSRAISTRSTRCFRSSRSAAGSRPARFRAVSSRCWRSRAR